MKKLDINLKNDYTIHRCNLGHLRTNCYLVSNHSDAILIDPGAESPEILNFITKNKLNPNAILLTHCHFDHTAGINMFPEVPVYINSLDEKSLTNSDQNALNFFSPEIIAEYDLNFKNPINTFENNEVLSFNSASFTTLLTPGHTTGSSSFLFQDSIIFTGDFLFKNTVGRCDLFGSSVTEMEKSILLFKSFKKDYIILPGHGHSTTLFCEQNFNPYFK